MIVLQVCKLIDGLTFTSEGYSRVKAVLLAKFIKPTVVAKAHIKFITSKPVVSGTHPYRIHDFLKNYRLVYRSLIP